MHTSELENIVAALVQEFLEFYKQGKLDLQDTKHFIEFCTDALDDFDGDPDRVMSLLKDHCSVCLQIKADSELIEWNPDIKYNVSDERSKLKSVAYNNCFGPTMIGGRVCVQCAKKLPINGPLDIE